MVGAKFAAVVITLLLSTTSQPVEGANDTWVGNTSSNWNDLNWTGGNNPPATSGDALLFGAAGSSGTTLTNDFASLSVTSVTFTAGSDAYTINGNALTLSSSATGIINSGTNLQDFKTGILLGNNNVLTSAAGGGDLTFDGVIADTVARTLTINGGGVVTLNGGNTYSGTTTVGGGQLNINNGGSAGTSSSLGISSLTFSAASTIDNTSGAAVSLSTNNAVTLSNNTVTFGGTNNLDFGTGAVTWASNNQTFALNGANSVLTFGGTVTNSSNSTNEGMVVNGVGNTLILGGFTSSNHSTGKVWLLSGTANINVIGQISNGTDPTLGLTFSGSGMLTLSGDNIHSGVNTFSGGLGTVNVNSSTALGTGNVALNGITLDNTSGAAITLANNNTQTWGGNNTFAGTNDLNLGTGAVTLTATRIWTIRAGTLTVGGAIGQSSSGLGFTKTGDGTMVLMGTGTYTGTTGLQGGTLTLDFSNVSAGTGIINSTSILSLGTTAIASSQTLNLNGKDSTADTQSFTSTTFNGGGAQGGGATHVILSTSGAGGSMTLALGNFTNTSREIGAAIDFNIPANTFVTTTSPIGTDGLLQNNPTVNGNDFATVSGGNIVGLSTTAGGYASISNGSTTLTASKANDIAAGSVSTNTLTASSLRFNDGTGDTTLTINSGKVLTVRSTNNFSGAILVTSAVGAHTVKITGGAITGVNSRDLAIIQNNTQGLLEIDSVIADNGSPGNDGLTKSGPGTVILTASNTYTNSTYIDEGTLIADGAANTLGTNSGTGNPPNVIAIASGATLQIGNNDAGGNLSTGLAATPTIIKDNGSVVFNRADNALQFSIVMSGTGSVSQSGTGTVALTGANTYTGATTVNSGNLQVGASGVGQTGTGTTTVNGALAILSGTGTVQGATAVTQGSINPGDNGGSSMGTLNLAGGATFSPSTSSIVGNLTLGTGGAGDMIHITGGLILNSNSTFAVTFDPGYSVNTGDSWTLMDWSGALALNGFNTGANLRTGGESALVEGNLDLPDLTSITGYAGQVWQISDLTNNGALSVSIVDAPEPGRTMLLVVGLAGMVMRRRRKR